MVLLFEPPGSLRGSCSTEQAAVPEQGTARPVSLKAQEESCTGQSLPHAGNLFFQVSLIYFEAFLSRSMEKHYKSILGEKYLKPKKPKDTWINTGNLVGLYLK